jgi:protein tyrosine phosphatase (PTP) superfamily phosphohydrolase (DUF442 family)
VSQLRLDLSSAESKNRSIGGLLVRRRRLLVLGFLLVTTLTAVAASSFSDNFHPVITGAVYRSGQPSANQLANHIADEGIRSIVNVRASNPGADWYEEERAVAARRHVEHYSVGIDSACPLPDEVRTLIPILDCCPKPVLVHCQSGIDRTGPVAAICILLLDDRPQALEDAKAQLGLRYGHLFWRTNTKRQQAFLGMYEAWLAVHHNAHCREHFREWALRVYDRVPD